MFHGVLTRDRRLSYCNAGHEPPCVIGTDGVRWLETGGTRPRAFQRRLVHV